MIIRMLHISLFIGGLSAAAAPTLGDLKSEKDQNIGCIYEKDSKQKDQAQGVRRSKDGRSQQESQTAEHQKEGSIQNGKEVVSSRFEGPEHD